MNYTIENSEIKLTVASHGAEIVSLLKGDKEYIWSADSSYWGRHAPILFPFVGSVHDNKYRYDGVEYQMGQHGFARDKEFTLDSQTDNCLRFVLKDNDETLSVYPFHFNLFITYTLSGSEVAVKWEVVNTDTKQLHFSIGGHPGFMCPFQELEPATDGQVTSKAAGYTMLLKKSGAPVDALDIHYLQNGGVKHETEHMPLTNGHLLLTDELFDRDALVLEDQQIDQATIVDPAGTPVLTVKFDTPVAGIWSPDHKHAPFVCIEPWFGRADAVDFTGSLEDRQYGNQLAPSEKFENVYTIVVE